ncbi:hypothetical protein ACWIUA_02155 [Ursidibacter sp. B-7004-1]
MKNNTEMTITYDEFQMLIISAERYAIGRMTYVVSETCDLIANYLPSLSNNTLSVLIRDIKAHPKDSGSYGLKCDTENWLNLLSLLEAEYEKRKETQ